ncbi:UDP-N-acetylglucosamine--N-acetylmuramyl-(pentapeptide) pyrophosphoryl-undecaprenol N-acetylglucosamine transferase [Candidatus Erwinia haradaeae]|uniref:UDP-N-acetylglucosamine--N-acetylmuramyl-(pentapeptide) pyrophosphoryl-undecaprenol N-acetylglucosamine transferase n=1 Tax=Candidatus Erwinia haradaeae TaxID=1922217 RepID=A0A451CZE0_9GAMM|nr:UDP-N-acetylglucosamine--N-acetylmuramyl-(pentapeptide) pyrophosphoryl-undecaprenol N-acetylglucosamine transferase [Candidatus Erwinia haradaeae]
MNQKKLLVIAGGTGGHIFPGLAVSIYLKNIDWKIYWLGATGKMEEKLVQKHGITIEYIRISGLRGKSIKTLLSAPLNIVKAWIQAQEIIKKWKPDVALGMGGYITGPGGLAAWSCGVPLILHEQNSIAGLTNKLLAKITGKVIQAFPGAWTSAEVVGNPVRTEILSLPKPSIRFSGRQGPIRVLVIGGSQGAHILNQIIPQVAYQLGNKICLWHQVGKGAIHSVKHAYMKINSIHYRISEFINNMAHAYSWADVVICRSGAMTVSELAVVGLPAIFVPFQHKDRQQYWNALLVVKTGGAVIYEEHWFTADLVAEQLASWDRLKLLEMANKVHTMAILDSTERVAEIVRNAIR